MVLVAVLAFVMIAGLGFVFAGGDNSSARTVKRAQAIVSGGNTETRVRAARAAANSPESRRKAILQALKEQDKQQKRAILSIEEGQPFGPSAGGSDATRIVAHRMGGMWRLDIIDSQRSDTGGPGER